MKKTIKPKAGGTKTIPSSTEDTKKVTKKEAKQC
jgi:hypothetical protein